jgi:signal transduction histidine kinase
MLSGWLRDISLRDWLMRWCLGLLLLIQVFACLGLYWSVHWLLWSKAYSLQLGTIQRFWANRPPIMDGELNTSETRVATGSESDLAADSLEGFVSTLLIKQMREAESGGTRTALSFKIWGPVMVGATSALAECSGSRLYGTDGSLISSGGSPNPLPILEAREVQHYLSGRPIQVPAKLGQLGEHYVLYFPLVSHGHVIGLLQSANSAAPIQKKLRTLCGIIVFSNSLGLIFGYCVLMWISKALSAPLDSLMLATQSVAGGDLDARTGLASSRNEIFALGSAFDQMAEQLQASFEAQNRFVADASHELKTPLTTLSGMAEILQLDPLLQNGRSARAVQMIVGQVERMNELVSDLLVLSQSVEVSNLDLQAVNLFDVLEDLVDGASMRYSQTHRLTCECPARGLLVAGPESRLRRIFGNILDNALQYTPEGGTVSIRASLVANQIEVRICDTGPGIAPQDLPRLCDRFFRADRSRARHTGGTGLGLAIVKAMVTALNGRLEISSALCQGTEVRVSLPLAASSQPRNDDRCSEADRERN